MEFVFLKFICFGNQTLCAFVHTNLRIYFRPSLLFFQSVKRLVVTIANPKTASTQIFSISCSHFVTKSNRTIFSSCLLHAFHTPEQNTKTKLYTPFLCPQKNPQDVFVYFLYVLLQIVYSKNLSYRQHTGRFDPFTVRSKVLDSAK